MASAKVCQYNIEREDAKKYVSQRASGWKTNKTIDNFMWLFANKLPNFGGKIIYNEDGNKYLLRLYLTPKRHAKSWWPGIFLHRFFQSDYDRELHNHPWNFSFSIILTGGYLEERWLPKFRKKIARIKTPISANLVRANDFHRVELLDRENGSWTLFVALKKVQNWGFLNIKTDEFTSWQEMMKVRGEEPNEEIGSAND